LTFILGLLLWLTLGVPSPTVDGDALVIMTVGLLVAASAWAGKSKAVDASFIAFGGAAQALYFASSDLMPEFGMADLTWSRALRVVLVLVSLVSTYWASRWVLSRGNKVLRALFVAVALLMVGVATLFFRTTTVA
jgi:hypothetical protein